jgi:hypothetical protein
LASDQRHCLGLLIVQVDLGDRRKHRQRIGDQPRHQRLLGLKVIQAQSGLPGWS